MIGDESSFHKIGSGLYGKTTTCLKMHTVAHEILTPTEVYSDLVVASKGCDCVLYSESHYLEGLWVLSKNRQHFYRVGIIVRVVSQSCNAIEQ